MGVAFAAFDEKLERKVARDASPSIKERTKSRPVRSVRS
jgi:hypothetical protein